MDAFLQQFQDLKIQLEEIKSATNNFDDEKNYIGGGGFGKVYKGEVCHSKGRSMVAIKRLDPKHGQGIPEFLKEITMLSRYSHENLISLLGFCYQGDEMILVYEHASRGSLDRHLGSPHLTWTLRLKICIDVAKGLSYLHDPRETHQRLIHCDVKSGNILLDDQWNGKVSDFGLSIMGPANEQQSIIVTFAAGTLGYCDPQYAMTHTLTKESDVYSFGVVLFEVLCGRLCYTYKNGGVSLVLVPSWIESYKHKKLNDIIFKNPTIQPLRQSSLEIFSNIAFRCLNKSREDRPKMAEVVTELENALQSHEYSEDKSFFEYKAMVKTAEPSLNYRSKDELMKLLSKGVFLNGGKTWFSLNKKGEHCEMIAIAECFDPESVDVGWSSKSNYIRFAGVVCYSKDWILKTHVKTQFLSPGITYAVNLVFIFSTPTKVRKCEQISLKYNLNDWNEILVSHLAYEKEDGLWMAELYQFTSDSKTVDLKIVFCDLGALHSGLVIEAIEFLPLDKVEHKVSEDEKLIVPHISDLDADWEEHLPINFEDIMKWSIDKMQWNTKKEAYSIIRKGFLIDNGEKWFSLDKNGKKCHMLSPRTISTNGKKQWMSLHESRFGEVCQCDSWKLVVNTFFWSHLVSSETTYASYLVYKLPKNNYQFGAPMKVSPSGEKYLDVGYTHWFIYLESPQTPVILPKADQNTHNPLNKPKIKGLPQQRDDGWMEVEIWEFKTTTITNMISKCLDLTTCGDMLSGLIIQGVETRPI